MRIIFVRHGHPNYEKDCLTALGHLHGQAVAERLKAEPLEKIYSSTCGRAMETAEHIDGNFGLRVEGLEFMREIKWGSVNDEAIYEDGHPWLNSDYLVEQGKDLLDPAWRDTEQYRNNKVVAAADTLAHLFNLPFPFVCSAICPDYTAVTVVSFSDEEGGLTAPKFEIMNDARHIAEIKRETKGFVYA